MAVQLAKTKKLRMVKSLSLQRNGRVVLSGWGETKDLKLTPPLPQKFMAYRQHINVGLVR